MHAFESISSADCHSLRKRYSFSRNKKERKKKYKKKTCPSKYIVLLLQNFLIPGRLYIIMKSSRDVRDTMLNNVVVIVTAEDFPNLHT